MSRHCRPRLIAEGGTLDAMVDQDEVLEALTNVIDPELGLDFVELGLVYGVEIAGGTVTVTFTLTSLMLPRDPTRREGAGQRRS